MSFFPQQTGRRCFNWQHSQIVHILRKWVLLLPRVRQSYAIASRMKPEKHSPPHTHTHTSKTVRKERKRTPKKEFTTPKILFFGNVWQERQHIPSWVRGVMRAISKREDDELLQVKVRSALVFNEQFRNCWLYILRRSSGGCALN